MTVPGYDPQARIAAALQGVDPSAPSTSKFHELDVVLEQLLGGQPGDVVAVTVSKKGNLSVRSEQSKRAQNAAIAVAVVTDNTEIEGIREAARDRVRQGRTRALVIVRRDAAGDWFADWGVQPAGASPGPLDRLRLLLGIQLETVECSMQQPQHPSVVPAQQTMRPVAVPSTRLRLDPRVRRMLRLAVASRPAVMLVGPPGTGKSTLVAEIVQEVAQNPAAFGMTTGHEVTTVTPDESWTARELVGGDTVDDKGRLRFAPGAVLDALSQDRWLVLDEANRADMDRIFGSLLTWLAGQPVDVGKLSPDPGSGSVHLGWADGPLSVVEGAERLRADSPGTDQVEYLAGSEWRLLGTYNALDAQRVFRFGLALGRRFAHVPVPAPTPEMFAEVLDGHLVGRRPERWDDVRQRIVALYSAHQRSGAVALGPAAFLDLPGYVTAGLDAEQPVAELLAEAYLTALGTWLARLEENELDRLGTDVGKGDALGGEWAWVRSQLVALR